MSVQAVQLLVYIHPEPKSPQCHSQTDSCRHIAELGLAGWNSDAHSGRKWGCSATVIILAVNNLFIYQKTSEMSQTERASLRGADCTYCVACCGTSLTAWDGWAAPSALADEIINPSSERTDKTLCIFTDLRFSEWFLFIISPDTVAHFSSFFSNTYCNSFVQSFIA